MKYKAVIEITFKPEIQDVPGSYVLNNIRAAGYENVQRVRQGKVIEVEFEAEPNDAAALIKTMCEDLLVNPVTETYGFRLQFTGQQGWGETPMRYTVDEDDVKSVDLTGKFPTFGPYEILRAEWKVKDPTFVLIRYAKDGVEQELGLRMDLDKQAILDDFEDPACDADRLVKENDRKIWTEIVIGMRDAGEFS